MLLLYSIKELKKKNVTAFSIQFNGQGDKTLKKLCKNSGINLIEENFTEEDFWNNILCAAEKIDEPVADYAILPTLKLSEKASKYLCQHCMLQLERCRIKKLSKNKVANLAERLLVPILQE